MQIFRNDALLVESESVFVHKCAFCDEIMNLSEGDVLYSSKWYHKSCWNCVEKEQDHNKDDFGLTVSHA